MPAKIPDCEWKCVKCGSTNRKKNKYGKPAGCADCKRKPKPVVPRDDWRCINCGAGPDRRAKYGACLECKKKYRGPIKTMEPCKTCGGTERNDQGGCVPCRKASADKQNAKQKAKREAKIVSSDPCAKCGISVREPGYSYCVPCRKENAADYRENAANLPCHVCGVNPRYRHAKGVESKCYHCILNNPKRIDTQLRKKYGIGLEEYKALDDAQGGECAVCGNRNRAVTRSVLGMVVDHDHDSGAVRGLLCGFCNQAIGLVADDPKIAERMAKYLRDHGRS